MPFLPNSRNENTNQVGIKYQKFKSSKENLRITPYKKQGILEELVIAINQLTEMVKIMETRTVKLLKVMPNMSRQVKSTLVVEPKLREGDKDLEHRD